MNWRWILMLAALGVVVSAAGLFGWFPSSIWVSVGLLLVCAVLLGYNVKQKHFMNGFWTGVIWSVVGGILTILFWDTYLANNPSVAEKMSQVPEGFDPRMFSIIGIVIGAAINGVLLGLLTLLAGKLLNEKETPAPPPETNPPV